VDYGTEGCWFDPSGVYSQFNLKKGTRSVRGARPLFIFGVLFLFSITRFGTLRFDPTTFRLAVL